MPNRSDIRSANYDLRNTKLRLVFWQPIASFHQQGLLNALAKADWVDSVTLKVETLLPETRRKSGWSEADLSDAITVELIQSDEVPEDAADCIHIFTGFDTHPKIWGAYHRMGSDSKAARWAYAEAPELCGFKGCLRQIKYAWKSKALRESLDGMLALGDLGADFYRSLLAPKVPVHAFAYYDALASDLPKLKESTAADKTVRFLYLGQHIHRKGLDRLITALAEIKGPAWQLDCVGGGAEKENLMELANKLGLGEQVQWHPTCSNAETESWYQQADYVLLPSRWDGWGMTLNEGLRHGCEVIATETCGAAVLVQTDFQLPLDSKSWSSVLKQAIERGPLTLEQRQANQQRAQGITGEAGAELLHKILR